MSANRPKLTGGTGPEGELAHWQFQTIERWFGDIRDDIAEVKALAQATNGRVRALELRQAEMRGAKRALDWMPPLASSLATAAFSVLLYVLFLPH